MARRGSRSSIFTDIDKRALLEAGGACRDACIRARMSATVGGDIYNRAGGSVIEVIDSVVEVLTGD